MTETLTLFLPCDSLPIRVRYGYSDKVSPLETAVLRLIAVKAAAERIDSTELSGLLGLSRRVVLDLLQDLWKQGYIALDFAGGTVGLSRKTAEAYAAGGLERLPSAETTEGTVEVVLDRIGGFLCPAPSARSRFDFESAVQHPRPELSLRDIPHSELLRALRGHIDRLARKNGVNSTHRRALRLVTAGLAPSALARQPTRRWLPVEATAARSQATGRLIVTIVDEHYPEARRPEAEQTLAELAERHPQEPFARRLAALADRSLPTEERPDLHARLASLVDRVARTPRIPEGKRWHWHLELQNEARSLEALLDLRVRQEMSVEPVSRSRHPDIVRELIAAARTQIVLVCPWIEYHVFREYEDALRDARKQGVQIIIVWGMHHEQKLEKQEKNSIASIGRVASTAELVCSLLPSRVHAKAIICDDTRALVTSHNMLSSPGNRRELGLLTAAPSPNGSDVVRELLGWVRSVIPDGPTSRKVLSYEADFRSVGASETEAGASAPAGPPPLPAASPDLDDAAPDRVAIWAGAWSAYAETLQARLSARELPSVEPVVDGRHRDLLWRAVSQAQSRLLITSDQISENVVDDRFAAALARRLGDPNGPRITLVYGREADGSRGARAAERLRALLRQYPNRLAVRQSENHAKILVCDDEVMVGSFNFLSYGGHKTLGSPHHQRSELSLRLVDPAVANRLIADWRVKETSVAAPVPRQSTRPSVTEVNVPSIPPTIQRLLDPMLEATGDPARLRAAVAELPSDEPWPLLEALHSVGATEVLRAAVPRALADRTPEAGPVRRWQHWLTEDLWLRERYVEAALLRMADPADAPRPRRPLALVAAARGTSDMSEALLAAVYAEPDPDEAVALLVTAVVEAVRHGSSDARDLIAYLPSVEDPWNTLVPLCDEYLEKAKHTPLSSMAVDGFVMQSRLRAQEAEVWEMLGRALAAARQFPGKIDIAKKILVAFFRDDGRFGQLIDAVSRREIRGVHAFLSAPLERHGDPNAQLTVLIEQTGAEVAPTSASLQYTYLKSLLKRLRPVIEQARLLADLSEEPGTTSGQGDFVGTAASKLKANLTGLLPEMHTAARRLPPIEERLILSALADLTAPLDLKATDE